MRANATPSKAYDLTAVDLGLGDFPDVEAADEVAVLGVFVPSTNAPLAGAVLFQ